MQLIQNLMIPILNLHQQERFQCRLEHTQQEIMSAKKNQFHIAAEQK